MRGDEKTGYREGKEDDGSAVFDLQEKKEEGPAQGEGFVDIAPPGCSLIVSVSVSVPSLFAFAPSLSLITSLSPIMLH
eukprot:1389670-Amorphochlora_amoeboformis.AAC.1